MTPQDSDLLLRLRDGDDSVFPEIVTRFERRLIGYFRSLCRDPQLAEDCAQEVFVRLYRSRENYTPDASAAAFIFRIARNYWIDRYRSRSVRPEARSLDAGGESGGKPLSAAVAADDVSPDEQAERDEDKRRLYEALSRLPEIQASVLALAAGQGMKYEEVAEVLGIPVGTVKSRVHAAVQNLRRHMGVKQGKTR